MRHIIFILTISLFVISCGQNDNKQKELELKEKELALKEKELYLDSIQESASQATSKYSNLNLFWTDFKNAAVKKDYKKINELTYFPFLMQNNYIYADDFKEFTFDNNNILAIKNAKTPTIGSMFFGGGSDINGNPVNVKFNEGSIYEVSIGGPTIYFSKINDEFKFIAILYGE